MEPVHIAVLVGSTAYQGDDNLPALRFTGNDVARFLRTLQPYLAPENVRILLEPDEEAASSLREAGVNAWSHPTAEALEKALVWAQSQTATAQKAGQEARVILFISAHGDTNGLHLQDGLFTGARLQALLDALAAETVLLVADACYSETWLSAKGPLERLDALPTDQLFPRDQVADVIRGLERVGAITSQTMTREEPSLVRGGDLTHEVASGWLGAADLDQDRRITYLEMDTWLRASKLEPGRLEHGRHSERSAPGRAWRAHVMPPRRAPEEPAVLVNLRALPLRGLLFPPNSSPDDERYLVRDPDGRVVAELVKRGGDRRRLYLPPGTYQVQRFSPPDAWFGQEGSFTVRSAEKQPTHKTGDAGKGGHEFTTETTTETTTVALQQLKGQWQWPDGKGRDARAAPEGARTLSPEEATYATRSRFHKAVTWRDLPERVQSSVGIRLISPGFAPAFALEGTAFEGDDSDLLTQNSLTRESPAFGLAGAIDWRVTPLAGGYFALGVGGSGLITPATTIGNDTEASLMQVEGVVRAGFERHIRTLSLRLTGYGGFLLVSPQTKTEPAACVEDASDDDCWNRLKSMSVTGLEVAISARPIARLRPVFLLSPHGVLERQDLGNEVRIVPYLALSVGAGVAW